MILVTGATGNVGRELVPQLLEAGEEVRVLVRGLRSAVHLDDRAERAVGDLDRPETLEPAMVGVRALYLIASSRQVANAVAVARVSGVSHVVRQSTIEAGAVPPLGPGRWHREDEVLIESSGIAWTHLRPTMMMVNTIAWWAESICGEGAVFFPGGDGRVSPVDPRDVAAVGRAVLTQRGHEGRAYEVTGPELLTIGGMVEVLSRVLGKPLRYVDIPERAAGVWMAKRGVPLRLVDALVETLGAVRTSRFAYVADTVERLTGREGRSFEAWCRENVAAFGDHTGT